MNPESPTIQNATSVREDTIPCGNERLRRITVTPRNRRATLLLLPGYGDHAGRYLHFLKWLGERGIESLAIDFRGHGKSTGRRGFVVRWEEYLQDLGSFLRQQGRSNYFILGHSHGALVAAAAAIEGKLNCTGCILSAPYFELQMPINWRKRILAAVGSRLFPAMAIDSQISPDMLSRDPEMQSNNKEDPLVVGVATPRWFVTTRRMQEHVQASAAQFSIPLLMLVPGQDSIANPAASIQFFEQASSADKTLKAYKDHHHELLRDLDREMIFEDIRNWMEARS